MKMVRGNKEELKRCINAIFDIMDREKISKGIAMAAMQIIIEQLHKEGVRVMIEHGGESS